MWWRPRVRLGKDDYIDIVIRLVENHVVKIAQNLQVEGRRPRLMPKTR